MPAAHDGGAEFTAEAGVGISTGARSPSPELNLALVGRPTETWVIGAQAFLSADDGMDTMLGGGIVARWLATPTERFAWGVVIQGGWAYSSLGVPLSAKVGERFWLWTQPSAVLTLQEGIVPGSLLPLGVSIETKAGTVLSFQAALRSLGYYNDPDLHLGFAVTPRTK